MTLAERFPVPSRLGLLAALGSGALLGGAYYFQYVVGLSPCEMCLWQRYPHMVAIVVGLLALASFAWPRLALVFMLTAITALLVTSAIGVFHVGVEYHWWDGPQACTGNVPKGLSPDQLKKYLFGAKMVRCDETAWSMWGISMAGWNAILSAVLAYVLASNLAGWMRSGELRNPGDPEPRPLIERTIRVDQAGEFGAVRIYEGQLAALRWTGRSHSVAGRKIAAMARAEREHNREFDRLLAERRVRPTALSPLWNVAGFALGAATALMGDKAAMACTVAIEETIDEHYASQAAALGDDEADLRATIEKFRAEEIEHKDTALAAGAEEAPAYTALTSAIKAGSRLAIWLSSRI